MAEKRSKRTKSAFGGRPNREVRHSEGEDTVIPANPFQNEPDEQMEDNDISVAIRDSIREALRDSTKNISQWLKDVGDDNPARALALFKDLTEYVVPRLQRADGKLDGGSPVQVVFEGLDAFMLRKEDKEPEITEKQDKKPIPNGKFF